MACYATHLAQGQNLRCKELKSKTIRLYLKAAEQFIASGKQMSPLIDHFGNTAPLIQSVLHEVKRWEQIPKRREPLTKPMVLALQHKASTSSNVHTIDNAIADWATLGLFIGQRLSEFAQDATQLKNKPFNYTTNKDGSATAFIMSDFTFYANDRQQIPDITAKVVPTPISIDVKWRFQKNGQNGQIITFASNPTDTTMCPVRAAVRICQRAAHFGVPANFPIGVARAVVVSQTYRFITNDDLKTHFQQAAAKVYNITNKQALTLWTAHSIRVGAAVLLQEMGKSADFIQQRLRWLSDAYKVYLRNLPQLALEHNTVVSNASRAVIL